MGRGRKEERRRHSEHALQPQGGRRALAPRLPRVKREARTRPSSTEREAWMGGLDGAGGQWARRGRWGREGGRGQEGMEGGRRTGCFHVLVCGDKTGVRSTATSARHRDSAARCDNRACMVCSASRYALGMAPPFNRAMVRRIRLQTARAHKLEITVSAQ
jgi:hypothetical protein